MCPTDTSETICTVPVTSYLEMAARGSRFRLKLCDDRKARILFRLASMELTPADDLPADNEAVKILKIATGLDSGFGSPEAERLVTHKLLDRARSLLQMAGKKGAIQGQKPGPFKWDEDVKRRFFGSIDGALEWYYTYGVDQPGQRGQQSAPRGQEVVPAGLRGTPPSIIAGPMGFRGGAGTDTMQPPMSPAYATMVPSRVHNALPPLPETPTRASPLTQTPKTPSWSPSAAGGFLPPPPMPSTPAAGTPATRPWTTRAPTTPVAGPHRHSARAFSHSRTASATSPLSPLGSSILDDPMLAGLLQSTPPGKPSGLLDGEDISSGLYFGSDGHTEIVRGPFSPTISGALGPLPTSASMPSASVVHAASTGPTLHGGSTTPAGSVGRVEVVTGASSFSAPLAGGFTHAESASAQPPLFRPPSPSSGSTDSGSTAKAIPRNAGAEDEIANQAQQQRLMEDTTLLAQHKAALARDAAALAEEKASFAREKAALASAMAALEREKAKTEKLTAALTQERAALQKEKAALAALRGWLQRDMPALIERVGAALAGAKTVAARTVAAMGDIGLDSDERQREGEVGETGY